MIVGAIRDIYKYVGTSNPSNVSFIGSISNVYSVISTFTTPFESWSRPHRRIHKIFTKSKYFHRFYETEINLIK